MTLLDEWIVALKEEEEFALSQEKACQLISCTKRYAVRDSDAITPELYCSVDCELTEGEKELLDGSDSNLQV